MATCCSILAWIIPWTVESGGLQSIGSVSSSAKWKELFMKRKEKSILNIRTSCSHFGIARNSNLIALYLGKYFIKVLRIKGKNFQSHGLKR